ncbi:auxin-responsive protein SAUR40 [Selaginella moellendorffii]|uniref:auxin-responsive protein SAUR40 n=1 Tax=Selaginella moellendorffii TaxID=88036 RepID=UPI000D1C3D14|nr:auxin-responsive protein SAUR40 [Selaginella moellendorffii]|eukprot:XP_002991268.2 auxin-responsive protein SAUR40 [Selaginella moellendorffii]
MTTTNKRQQSLLRGGDDRKASSNTTMPGRSSSFHKTVTKLVLKGLQELASLRSSRRSGSYSPLSGDKSSYSRTADVPRGYLAVYVGEQHQERFIVPTNHLHHPIFKVLLKKCEEKFGFCHQGPLQIPCPVDLFHLLLWHIENSDVVLDSSQAQELVDLYVVSLENL